MHYGALLLVLGTCLILVGLLSVVSAAMIWPLK